MRLSLGLLIITLWAAIVRRSQEEERWMPRYGKKVRRGSGCGSVRNVFRSNRDVMPQFS